MYNHLFCELSSKINSRSSSPCLEDLLKLPEQPKIKYLLCPEEQSQSIFQGNMTDQPFQLEIISISEKKKQDKVDILNLEVPIELTEQKCTHKKDFTEKKDRKQKIHNFKQYETRKQIQISIICRNIDNESVTNDQAPTLSTCICNKSQCLQMYCSCFRQNKICGLFCQCIDCLNSNSNIDKRNKLFDQKEKKNFIGCKCQKTGCLKGYCECYIRGKSCLSNCKCNNCLNKKKNKKLQI